MAELADALDLGSSGQPCGFDSHYPYQLVASDISLATSWQGRSKSIFLHGEKCRPQCGPPTVCLAERAAVEKEEQGSGRMTSFLPQA